MKFLKSLYCNFETRLQAFCDKSAWLLMLPALALLLLVDALRVLAISTWMLFAAVMVGFCVQISRIVWSGIDLPDLTSKARETPLGSAIIVAAIIMFVAVLFVSMAIWTKP